MANRIKKFFQNVKDKIYYNSDTIIASALLSGLGAIVVGGVTHTIVLAATYGDYNKGVKQYNETVETATENFTSKNNLGLENSNFHSITLKNNSTVDVLLSGTTDNNNGTKSCKYFLYEGTVPQSLLEQFGADADAALTKNHFDMQSSLKDGIGYSTWKNNDRIDTIKQLGYSLGDVLNNLDITKTTEISSKYTFDNALLSSCLFSNPTLVTSIGVSGLFFNASSKLTENGIVSTAISPITKDDTSGKYTFTINAIVAQGDDKNLKVTPVVFKVSSLEEDAYTAFNEGKATTELVEVVTSNTIYTYGYNNIEMNNSNE